MLSQEPGAPLDLETVETVETMWGSEERREGSGLSGPA